MLRSEARCLLLRTIQTQKYIVWAECRVYYVKECGTYRNHFFFKELNYCNGFDRRIARQQLCKHGPTRNNRGSCVVRVRGDVTQQQAVIA
jgi:hypothetical protein